MPNIRNSDLIENTLVFFYVEIPTSFDPCNLGLLSLYSPSRLVPPPPSLPRPLPSLFERDQVGGLTLPTSQKLSESVIA